MNRGMDRSGIDDNGTGSFYGSQNALYAPPRTADIPEEQQPGYGGNSILPGGKASIQDMMNSIVGLGSDPGNKAGYTVQDILNAQRAQATPAPAQPPMQPPFNPYQQFNYGKDSGPRGRGGYKNDRRFGGRLPGAVDPGFSYPPPKPDLPNMTIPENEPDGNPSGINRFNV